MKKNIYSEFERIKKHWSPSIIAEVNDVYVKLAKLKGDLVWHTHENEDELFLIVKGSMIIRYEHKEVLLNEGDIHVVPRGVPHFPVADNECHVLLIENKSTLHTGSINVEYTKTIEEQLYKEDK